MISLPTVVETYTPLSIPKQFRDVARQRQGDWEIHTWDWDEEVPDLGFFQSQVMKRFSQVCGNNQGNRVLQETVIVLSEREVPRMMHQLMHGLHNKTKMESIQANLEQTAESLWPTGSLEHVAMRWLAVPLMMRVVFGHNTKFTRPYTTAVMLEIAAGAVAGYFANTAGLAPIGAVATSAATTITLAKCLPLHADTWKTVMIRRTDASGSALNSHEGNDATPRRVDPAIGDTSESAKGKRSQEELNMPKMQFISKNCIISAGDVEMTEVPRNKHGGHTPEDADIIANEGNRIIDNNGIKLVVGQDYNGEDLDAKQIVGVLTAPTPKKPNVYSNTSGNAKAAKIERLDKKARPFTGTKEDKRKISRMIGEACGTKCHRALFSEKRIQKWAESFMHMEEIKSGKWSYKRLEDSLNNLFTQAYPEIKLKCAVKLEPMPEGKAPRLLIADGDDGQLMAMIVVRCLEDLLFEWFEDKSIKHCAKRKAVRRCVKELSKQGAKLVEGDGSAWDTTCNSTIRGLVENPVLLHILQVLTPYGVVPEQWHKEHLNCCEKKQLRLFFKKKLDTMRMTIDAIRRSGHRGTSCLNWWMNFVNWCCSIFKNPERFLSPAVRKGEDETGHLRWWNGCFEGDDSLCALFPPMKSGDELDTIFLSWWKRMGFNMKIVYAKDLATFCGYNIACEEGGVNENSFVCPELPRALVHAGVSCSSTIIAAAKAGDIRAVKDIAAAGALARAADFAGLLPSVSRKYHQYALSLKESREIVDREMSMRVMGEDGHNFTELEESIEAQNLAVTPTQEHENLRLLVRPATQRELEAFVLHPWSFESVGEFDALLASLPESWRPPADQLQ